MICSEESSNGVEVKKEVVEGPEFASSSQIHCEEGLKVKEEESESPESQCRGRVALSIEVKKEEGEQEENSRPGQTSCKSAGENS